MASAAAVAALIGFPAGMPAHASEPPGVRWPDGVYSVVMQGSLVGSGSGGDIASGSASGGASGQFRIAIDDGATLPDQRDDVFLLYHVAADGIDVFGHTGSGEMVLELSGYTAATDGRVGFHRELGVSTMTVDGVTLPSTSTPLDDEFQMIATSSSCGLIEGHWIGTFEGLELAATELGFAGYSEIRSHFLAVSDELTGLPDEWVTRVGGLVTEIDALRVDLLRGDAELDAAIAQAETLVGLAELELSGFTAASCPAPEGFGLGIGPAIRELLMEMLAGELTPLQLGQIAALAAESGAVDAEVAAAILDRVSEFAAAHDGAYPGELLHLATAAAAAGDTDTADSLFDRYLEES